MDNSLAVDASSGNNSMVSLVTCVDLGGHGRLLVYLWLVGLCIIYILCTITSIRFFRRAKEMNYVTTHAERMLFEIILIAYIVTTLALLSIIHTMFF